MGMSTYVSGFRPPDEKWKQMATAWEACRTAGVTPPDEVYAFFDGEPPDPQGIQTNLEEHECCSSYSDDGRQGFEIDISKLPENIKVIRFYNSW